MANNYRIGVVDTRCATSRRQVVARESLYPIIFRGVPADDSVGSGRA